MLFGHKAFPHRLPPMAYAPTNNYTMQACTAYLLLMKSMSPPISSLALKHFEWPAWKARFAIALFCSTEWFSYSLFMLLEIFPFAPHMRKAFQNCDLECIRRAGSPSSRRRVTALLWANRWKTHRSIMQSGMHLRSYIETNKKKVRPEGSLASVNGIQDGCTEWCFG